MRIALDTNILAYAAGLNGAERKAQARQVLRSHRDHDLILPAQVAAELYNLFVRKGVVAKQARHDVAQAQSFYICSATDAAVLEAAMELHERHNIG